MNFNTTRFIDVSTPDNLLTELLYSMTPITQVYITLLIPAVTFVELFKPLLKRHHLSVALQVITLLLIPSIIATRILRATTLSSRSIQSTVVQDESLKWQTDSMRAVTQWSLLKLTAISSQSQLLVSSANVLSPHLRLIFNRAAFYLLLRRSSRCFFKRVKEQ